VALLLQALFFFYKLRLDPIKKTFNNFKVAYIFIFVLLFSYLIGLFKFAPIQNFVALLYIARLLLYLAYPLYLYFFIKKNPGYKQALKKGLALFIVLTVISSTVQYFFYPDLRNLYYLGWDPHLNRLFGVFFDTSLAASILGLAFFYLYKNKKYIISLLFLVFFVLTFSRAAYVFFILTFLFDLMLSKNIKLGILILLTFVAVFIFAPKQFGFGVGLNRVFSISSRLADYQKAIKIWQEAPFVGHGYNRIQFVKEKMTLIDIPLQNLPSHSVASFSSSYLIILVTSGIIGLVLFIASIVKLGLINKTLTTYFLFIGLVSLTDNIILHSYVMYLLGVIVVVSLLFGRSRSKS
jgi:O-antigen ligase